MWLQIRAIASRVRVSLTSVVVGARHRFVSVFPLRAAMPVEPPVPFVFQELWSAIQKSLSLPTPDTMRRDVILHDPDATKPHDLDDPFSDAKAQERIGKTIANAAQNKAKLL